MNLYGELKELNLDGLKIAEVKDLTIKKDVAQFQLINGQVYILPPAPSYHISMTRHGIFSLTP